MSAATMSFMQPAPLCADLDAIVREELRLGNVLADWAIS